MGLLKTEFELTWKMELSSEGYTTWTLSDQLDRRWGWVINAPDFGWVAHIGDWGQADSLDLASPPLTEDIQTVATSLEGREFVEHGVANTWKWLDQAVRDAARPPAPATV